MEADASEPKRKKARADETLEPVFFHRMPTPFFTDLAFAFHTFLRDRLVSGGGHMRKSPPRISKDRKESYLAQSCRRVLGHTPALAFPN